MMSLMRIQALRSSCRALLSSQCALLTQQHQQTALSSTSTEHVSRIQNTPHLKRKLGQHLLVTESILTQIVDAAELPVLLSKKKEQQSQNSADPKLRVLEIGPGTGNLTSALLDVDDAVNVLAIEYDTRMVQQLEKRFAAQQDRLRIEQQDFEEFEFYSMSNAESQSRVNKLSAQSEHIDACVANIPYQLSSIVISRLTNYMHRFPEHFKCAVLLVQEEFALRLIAKPGEQNYSRLSANTALISEVTSVVKVGRNHFLPPPKVDSRVIKLVPRADRVVPAFEDEKLFFQKFDTMLRICFQRKNKTLRALLLSNTARSLMDLRPFENKEEQKEFIKLNVESALSECALNSSRAVQIPVQQFLSLMQALESRGIVFRPTNTRHFRD